MVRRSLAVVIPTRDRADELRACLDTIARHRASWVSEIVVIDDGSRLALQLDDELPSGVPLRTIRNAEPTGAAGARNRALTSVTADVVAFLDDDARIAPDWFEVLARELCPARGAVTGRVLPMDDGVVSRARQERYERRYAGLTAGDEVDFLSGGNSAVWLRDIVAVGGFPTTSTMSDSLLVERLRRAGRSCHFVPDLVIRHRHSKGVRCAIAQAWRAGRVSAEWRRARPPDARLDLGRLATGPDRAVAVFNLGLQVAFRAGRLAQPATARIHLRGTNEGGG